MTKAYSEKLLIFLIIAILVLLYYVDFPLRNFLLKGKEGFEEKRCGRITQRDIHKVEEKQESEDVETFQSYVDTDNNKMPPMSFVSGGGFGEFAPFNEQPDNLMGPLEIPKMEIINSLQAPPSLPETKVRVPKFQDTKATSREEEAQWNSAQWGKRSVTPIPTMDDLVAERKKNTKNWYGPTVGPVTDDPDTPEDELASANSRWRRAQGLASAVTPSPVSDAVFQQRVKGSDSDSNKWLRAGPVVDDPEKDVIDANAEWEKTQGNDDETDIVTAREPTTTSPPTMSLKDKIAARKANINKWRPDGGGPIVDDPNTPEDELALANADWRKRHGFDKIPQEVADYNKAELDDIIATSLTPVPMSVTMPPFDFKITVEDPEIVPVSLDNQLTISSTVIPELEYDYIGTPPPFGSEYSMTPIPFMSATPTPFESGTPVPMPPGFPS